MSIADNCAGAFSPATRSRGQAYFHDGRVNVDHIDEESCVATVDGMREPQYTVRLDWKHRRNAVMARCDCQFFNSGELCKHIWAALLAADLQDWLANEVLERRVACLRQRPVKARPREASSFRSARSVARKPSADLAPPAPRSAKPDGRGLRPASADSADASDDGWASRLAAIGRDQNPRSADAPARQAWFHLNVAASEKAGGLVIEYCYRQVLKRGGYGKIKRQSIEREDLHRYPDPEDQRMLNLLLGHPSENRTLGTGWNYEFDPARAACLVAPVMYSMVLPELCQSGRLFTTEDEDAEGFDSPSPIEWDEAGPWHFHLEASTNETDGVWTLDGTLRRDEETIRLASAPLVLGTGVFIAGNRLGQLAADETMVAWITSFRKGPVTVPFADRREFIKFWWNTDIPDAIAIPAPLDLPVERAKPVARLRILKTPMGGDRNLHYAQAEMGYRDNWIAITDPRRGVLDEASETIIARDLDREAAHEKQLADAGVVRNKAYLQPRSGSHQFRDKQLESVVFDLLSEGWRVEIEDEPVRGPGRFDVALGSGIDWLNLKGQVDFGGVALELPALLRAVERGSTTVRLADGSTGLLPDGWRERYRALATLGEVGDDEVRYRPAHALLIDALLNDEVADKVYDEQFLAWRSRFESFDGISARPVPSAFVGTLRPYQRIGYDWLEFLREFGLGGCLADDMGLGKTVQVLALLEAARTTEPGHPSLVVVPKSLVFNWLSECARFTPDLKVLEYTGARRGLTFPEFDDYDLIVTTYGIMRQDIAKLKTRPFYYAVLDESQAIKNPRSQTARAARMLDAKHRLAVTGTPIENHLGELWSQFEFLNPGLLGSLDTFETLGRQETHDSERAVLSQGLKPLILRRTKDQVAPELPPKTEQTLYCDIDGAQRDHYNELLRYYRTSIGQRVSEVGFGRAKVHVLEALLRLRQAACHPGLIDASRTTESSAKLDALLDQLESLQAEGHKALVFSQFTSLLAIVRHHVESREWQYEYLDGSTRDRQTPVERFQTEPLSRLFLISLKAGGYGLNLTAADYVFILDPWWNPAVEAQAIDRTHRIGQTQPVFAYRLIARDTVEERILELQRQKKALADAIIGADNAMMRDLTRDDLDFLLS
ncbi:MAG: DEAD/DEAH box helicase [Pseudomonadota bacterium]